MLSLESIQVIYGKIVAILDVSLSVGRSETVSIIGANGSGKSTLLKAIMGLVRISKGKIEFEGRRIEGLEPHRIVSMGISYVPEGRRLFTGLSVDDNLRLGAPRKCYDIEERFKEVFDLFPILYERRKQIAGTLSGGEQQMVAIGRALMARPKLIIMDEPSLGLSPKAFEKVLECILRIKDYGVSILLSEQTVEGAMEISDRTYIMENGRIVGHDKSLVLLSDPEIKKIYFGLKGGENDS
jgi:branched-chain amino acid transport system ATP-binding protein